ncbi:Methyltransferase domain-containing protein [Streptoalloteichus tenebrarius]|uniref:Methyltransferase domain-containing protein n=2 Tax=Streptoalloteichus tenebrarius (strain ATCC 17920 / DSM 40477 / JCM 4838 / CBS 697.72 / NBRC 16177 / NCIMB 11028 / NRRL B-12390 / A12253. 1 / ISP 5477) TaxID=1933 RepID=A0ABT1I1B4_STRSD|nr:Methyltransferase domain-containing protein [Streptoalloteichus tenebrarius]BFE99314.1 class I SAM-dependent methyltransferase [Streptoalloteichus tenebrarius]
MWWSINSHYHGWLLRQLPARAEHALDVGCGTGALVRELAARVERVDGVDVSARMIERAREKSRALSRVRWLLGDVLDGDLPLRPDGYDVVTAVSSLHHMPLRPAMARMAELVRPGGTLAVIGFYRRSTLSDHVVSAIALPAYAAVGAYRAAMGRGGKLENDGMPVQDPTTTLAEIRAAAAELLPGARVRRCLFHRYRLVWRRPS